jgi:outer membrane receptor protein involved in Fe transport
VLDWYSKKTDKVFSALSVDHTKGFSSLAMNLANVKNSGVELTLAYDWIRPQSREGFGWTTSGTASWNNNEVTYVEVQATRAFEQINLGYRKGDPIGSLYSYEFAGLNSRGSQEWLTADGRRVGVPIISEGIESVKFSGQIDPKHTFAMENRWTWNGLSLNVMMVYYGGHHMRAQQYHPLSRLTHAGPLASYYLNAWTPENTNTNVPGIGQHHDNTAPINEGAINNTDIFVHQADFFKIRNIVLGYDLPRTITSKFGVNSLSLRFQVDNPALWTKNSLGIDPETLGIRNPVCYIFGLNIRF